MFGTKLTISAILTLLACVVALGEARTAPGSGVKMLKRDVLSVDLGSGPTAAYAAQQLFGIGDKCTISATPMAFGTYNPRDLAPKYAQGTITVRCDWTLLPPIGGVQINLSTGSGSNFNRRMMNGAAQLPYNAYKAGDYAQVWGDGSSGTTGQNLSFANGETKNLTVYGRILAQQDVRAGSYVDNLTASVSWGL